MVEDTILHDDSIELCLTELTASNQYRVRYDANWTTELEIICAKHALWIYGESGGERADFSNCLLENVNLSNCNLCGADFSDATFINCNLDDASMCDADFENAKFKRCSLRHFTAEEADFKGSDFYNCDLRGACFTHSNFSKSKMADCNFHEVSFMNCCLESWTSTDCNLKIADMRNVSYDESEWFSEQDEELICKITDNLNYLIHNPTLIKSNSETDKSVDTIRTENEINRMLEIADVDKNILQQKIFELAALKYADLDSGSYISEQIKSEFENAESLKQISLPLLMKTTQAIQLNTNAQISLVLKNNQIIGKEKGYGTENSQVHSTDNNGTIQYKESISARESSSLLPRIYKAG